MPSSPITQLPSAVRPVLERYLTALCDSRVSTTGVYLYGSLCLGGFDPRSSDIDLLVLTPQVLSTQDVNQQRHLHATLGKAVTMAHRLEIAYLPLPYATLDQTSDLIYPVVRDGSFLATGSGDVNAVTWWQLHHLGLVLHGPSPATLALPNSWEAVEAAMHHNLVTYWPARAAEPGRFLDEYWVQFTVTTLCRILTTLEEQQIESKDAALERWTRNLPPRWHRLLRETRRIRHAPHLPSLYSAPDARAQDVRGFLTYVQVRSTGDVQRGASATL
jgi:predicted nucleotidyltransferase